VRGGKARTCWALARAEGGHLRGLVTAGSRSSPQVNIVAHIARELGVPARLHTPAGAASPEVAAAEAAGGERISHRPGYNSVIIARAAEDARALGYLEIPFGMECEEAVRQTADQVEGLPWPQFSRLVVSVGSGMSLAGILWGLVEQGRWGLPVLGVYVGADPTERLQRWAPFGWAAYVELQRAPGDYHRAAPAALHGLVLDPVYEAKAVPYLRPGDLLWAVGIRQTAV
jgi:1-aminocyclopropane-1-carboxylate deaminase/D-cysteine desulfhydrase-like pyridoxal-dependent ACC family enzyme